MFQCCAGIDDGSIHFQRPLAGRDANVQRWTLNGMSTAGAFFARLLRRSDRLLLRDRPISCAWGTTGGVRIVPKIKYDIICQYTGDVWACKVPEKCDWARVPNGTWIGKLDLDKLGSWGGN